MGSGLDFGGLELGVRNMFRRVRVIFWVVRDTNMFGGKG